jgi:hypothetical protein
MREQVASSSTKEYVGVVPLLDRRTGEFVEAHLFRGLDQKNFSDYEQLWKPELDRARAASSSWLEAAKFNAQDSHWMWTEKGAKANAHMSLETFAVECDGKTQGMILLNLVAFGQLDVQKGAELVYVEMLATAPWNRKQLTDSPVYKGVGHILIGAAISLSIECEFQGRLALHSLPQSESWYNTETDFTNLGSDHDKKLVYFEATEDQARKFLENG